MKKKEARGGYREGAKRPLKYGEETVNVTIRLPKSQVQKVKDLVKNYLKQFEIK